MATHTFTLDIQAPVAEVFAAWRRPEDFPFFMHHVKAVRRTGPRRTHWTVTLAGSTLEWESEVGQVEENRKIAWRSVSGLPNRGEVHLEPSAGGTHVKVIFNYDPPYGPAGDLAEALGAGRAFENAVAADLARLKQRLETRVPAGEGVR